MFFTLTTMLTDINNTVQFVSKSHLSSLFQDTERYHKKKLREYFLRYYDPSDHDCIWTKHLAEDVMKDIRLHLAWELHLNTSQWSREAIGTRILLRFKELGILLFMKHVIKQDRCLT